MLDKNTREEIHRRATAGTPIMLFDYDERESEVDLVFHPKYIDFKAIQTMRKDAGGLICFVVGKEINRYLKLPKMTRILRSTIDPSIVYDKTKYGDEPAFSITVNHISTRTGISDIERWKTIHELSKMDEHIPDVYDFFRTNFRAPGHVHLLVDSGIRSRRGHTELSVELFRMSKLAPFSVICEMLDDSGRSMDIKTAKDYAEENNILLIDGKQIAI